MHRIISGRNAILALYLFVQSTLANTLTNGLDGINSSGLGLTGAGVAIGQVEEFRLGDPNFDTVGARFHALVDPAAVYFRQGVAAAPPPPPNFTATMDLAAEISPPMDLTPGHNLQVAGIMISTDIVDPDGPGPMVALTGVATGASLYSVGDNGTGPDFDPESAISAQHLATLPGVDVRAINMSFGNPLVGAHILDGDQLLTQYVDWSAAKHDVLYVIAGHEGTSIPIPTDNFNGMTIAFSERVGAVWRRVGAGNTYDEDAEGDRTSIALIAPGDGFEMTNLGTTRTMVPHPTGTSFAAPHVTGTVALLQQFANNRIINGGWNAVNSRRHEVMKAVLMNSADKLIDNNTVMVNGMAVPQGGLLGMGRTVIDQQGNDWLLSEAYDDSSPEGGGRGTPLDDQMGAGHLNATRALQQFNPGEYESNSGDVPTIGWDYGHTTGLNDVNEYPLAGMLTANHFISITLVWDRQVAFNVDADMDG